MATMIDLGTSSNLRPTLVVAIFYPFSQFCEIDSSLLSLQKQPQTAPNLFQRGVEYGKYVIDLGTSSTLHNMNTCDVM